jgi:hypothetical protein
MDSGPHVHSVNKGLTNRSRLGENVRDGSSRLPLEITMKKPDLRIAILAIIVVMAACRDRKQSTAGSSATETSSPSAGPTTAPANISTQKWLGQWNGPEGTYLLLSENPSQANDKYVIKIQSLDGLETYQGIPAGDHMQFTRNGKAESIHAGDGNETGMKWLLGKKNCLIIKYGEGFCRD